MAKELVWRRWGKGVCKVLISKGLNGKPVEEFEFKGVGRIPGGMAGGAEAGSSKSRSKIAQSLTEVKGVNRS